MNTPQLDRDRSVDQLLRRAMRAGAVPDATDRCLEAETLAAWADGELPADAAALAEAHASTCGRCQAMLATLARTMPQRAPAESWWRRRWFIAGLVPLTAGTAAIAIWIAAPKDVTRIASSPVPVDVQLPASELRRPAAEPQPPSDPAATRAQPSAPPAREEPAGPVDRMETAREQRSAKARPTEGQEKAADARRRDEQAKATVSSAAPLSEPVGQLRAVVVEAASPDGSIRWRIGAAGMVQRSADGGATWTMLSSGATEDLTAAAAPSPTVCWIVGRAGTVLLTTDGRQWQRIAFPERVDLAAIQATDSRAATVTIVDGRTFRTADSGRTWTPLQEF